MSQNPEINRDMPKIPEHRFVRVLLAPELLLSLLSGYTTIYAHGLPADANVISFELVPASRSFCIVFEHTSFEPVAPYDEIPILGAYSGCKKDQTLSAWRLRSSLALTALLRVGTASSVMTLQCWRKL